MSSDNGQSRPQMDKIGVIRRRDWAKVKGEVDRTAVILATYSNTLRICYGSDAVEEYVIGRG